MQFMLQPNFPPLPRRLTYTDRIMLIGSCFTEHMYDRFEQHKFTVLQNPHGILFNPMSIVSALKSYIHGDIYEERELVYLNELWNSWDHHTRFSDQDKQIATEKINQSLRDASEFIRDADYLIITLGSAFQYFLKEHNRPVANNHRAPSGWFEKKLLEIDTITESLSDTIEELVNLNPKIRIILTISPVRHHRDGLIENNRSKARLIESVSRLCSSHSNVYYFPAYELVIDVLRDYRFYDIDMVHPNYPATEFVWEKFVELCIDPEIKPLMKEIQEITTAKKHRSRFPDTQAHRKFLNDFAGKTRRLSEQYPFLNLSEELKYFENIPINP